MEHKGIKGKYLISTDNYFICPDGKQYRAVFGSVEILSDSVLGIATNRNSSNWFIKVGNNDSHIIIAGCQIHYCTKCDSVDNSELVKDFYVGENGNVEIQDRPNLIYVFP